MNEMEGFVVEDGRAYYRPVGSTTFEKAVELLRAAIRAARASQARGLLVDATGLTGFDSPGVGRRFFAVEQWAAEARGSLPVALVLRSEMIHPEKFGVTVGVNRGFVNNVFQSEAEARAWLEAQLD